MNEEMDYVGQLGEFWQGAVEAVTRIPERSQEDYVLAAPSEGGS